MFTRREWSEEARSVIEDQLARLNADIGTGGVGTPKRSQREAMLGITGSRLGMAQSSGEREDILNEARNYITGGSSFGLKGSQLRELGQLGSMVSSGGPGEYERNQPANQAVPPLKEKGYESGGIISGKRDDSVGDDTVIRAKKGEYVIPTEVVDQVGIERLDRLVESTKKKVGLRKKTKSSGYINGGVVDPEKKDIRAYVETGEEGAPVQAAQATPQGYAPAVISPEAASKLYKAWGLGKEGPNWRPEYGAQVSTTSPGGARTTQVIQPGPGGAMPGVQLTSGRTIPMGLSRPAFEERASEEDILSRIPSAKDKAAYLESKAATGISRRKQEIEEELLPLRKRALAARNAPHGKTANEEKIPWRTKAELDAIAEQDKVLAANLKELLKNRFLPDFAEEYAKVTRDREALQGRRDELLGKTAPRPYTPTPAKPTGPSLQEFVNKVRAAGSKLSDAQLKAYYTQKYGGRK